MNKDRSSKVEMGIDDEHRWRIDPYEGLVGEPKGSIIDPDPTNPYGRAADAALIAARAAIH